MVSLLFRHHSALCHLCTASSGKLGGAWWGLVGPGGAWWGLGPRVADDKKNQLLLSNQLFVGL